MDSSQASSSPWSRQDILSLLQLMTLILIPLSNCIWHRIVSRSKFWYFRVRLSFGEALAKYLQSTLCVFDILIGAQRILLPSLLLQQLRRCPRRCRLSTGLLLMGVLVKNQSSHGNCSTNHSCGSKITIILKGGCGSES